MVALARPVATRGWEAIETLSLAELLADSTVLSLMAASDDLGDVKDVGIVNDAEARNDGEASDGVGTGDDVVPPPVACCSLIANAKKKLCSQNGCTNSSQKGGVCIRHGAKVVKRQGCSHEGCTNFAVKGGVCHRHGANVDKKRCGHVGCTKFALKGGVCVKHGAIMRDAQTLSNWEEFVSGMVR